MRCVWLSHWIKHDSELAFVSRLLSCKGMFFLASPVVEEV